MSRREGDAKKSFPRGGGRVRASNVPRASGPETHRRNVSGGERPTGEAAMGRGNAAGDGERDAPEVVSAVRERVYRRERERERENEQTKRTHGARLGVTRRRRQISRRRKGGTFLDDVTSPDARVECRRHARNLWHRKPGNAEKPKKTRNRERKKTFAVYEKTRPR